jgi:hypothetical protein
MPDSLFESSPQAPSRDFAQMFQYSHQIYHNLFPSKYSDIITHIPNGNLISNYIWRMQFR